MNLVPVCGNVLKITQPSDNIFVLANTITSDRIFVLCWFDGNILHCIIVFHRDAHSKSKLAETEPTMASKYQQTIGIKVKRVTNTHKLVLHRIISPDSSQIHPHYHPVRTLIWILKISFKSWPTMSRNKIKSDIRSVTPNI